MHCYTITDGRQEAGSILRPCGMWHERGASGRPACCPLASGGVDAGLAEQLVKGAVNVKNGDEQMQSWACRQDCKMMVDGG